MKQISYCTLGLLLFTIISKVSSLNENKAPRKHGNNKFQASNGKKKGKGNSNNSKRIIEGIKANQADYPFIVSLIYSGSHICGGSIITDKVILTAAHCCFDPLDNHFNSKSVSVAVGSSKWKSARKLKVSKIITHEQYDPDMIINDVALWILQNKMTNADNVAVIKLNSDPENEHITQIHATVLGWGFTSQNGLLIQDASEDLFMVNIYSVPLSECKKHYDYIAGGHICFSSPDRRGSCNGDSGGPLVVKKGPELVQIGLVSFGEDCNNTKPEVYTRISAYYPWIKNNVIRAWKRNW